MFGDLSKSNVDSDNDSFGNFTEMLLGSDPDNTQTVMLDYMQERNAKIIWKTSRHPSNDDYKYDIEKMVGTEFQYIEQNVAFNSLGGSIIVHNVFLKWYIFLDRIVMCLEKMFIWFVFNMESSWLRSIRWMLIS